jgi:hypothetical protein
MEKKETNKKLLKLQKKTFKNIDKRDVVEPGTIVGTTLAETSPILLTSDKKAENMILQFAGTNILLTAETLDFLVKSLTIMTAMTALDPHGESNELSKVSSLDHFVKNKHRFSIIKLEGDKSTDDEIQKKAFEIINPTASLIPFNSIGLKIKEELGILPEESELDFCIRKINESRSISVELFYAILENMNNVNKECGMIPEKAIARVNSIITENYSIVDEDLTKLSFEQLKVYGKKLLEITDEIFDIHKEYHGLGSIEEKKRMISNLISIFNKMPSKDQKFEDLIGRFLASNPSMSDKKIVEDVADKMIKEVFDGMKEEVAENAIEPTVNPVKEEKPFAFDESLLYEDAVEKPMPFPLETQSYETVQETTQDYQEDFFTHNQLEEEEDSVKVELESSVENLFFGNPSKPSEILDSDLSQNAGDSDFEYIANPQASAPAGSSFKEKEKEQEEEEEDAPIFDDDDDDPTTSVSDFSKRMDDLESMLTGAFELKKEELPSFEKIEKLKIEHGELAAKEYVASLSQEQRETLIRERIAIRDAALAKKESEQKPPESLSEEK